jgi:ankyrin repeat protein
MDELILGAGFGHMCLFLTGRRVAQDSMAIFEALETDNLPRVHTILLQDPSAASSRDEKENTVAMIAAMQGHTDVLMHLREMSIELLAGTNKYGMNSAHYAALYNQPQTLHFLWLNYPSLFQQRNFWGNLPADEAKRYANEETKVLLGSLVSSINFESKQ